MAAARFIRRVGVGRVEKPVLLMAASLRWQGLREE
jgi:hypothetical protein